MIYLNESVSDLLSSDLGYHTNKSIGLGLQPWVLKYKNKCKLEI